MFLREEPDFSLFTRCDVSPLKLRLKSNSDVADRIPTNDDMTHSKAAHRVTLSFSASVR